MDLWQILKSKLIAKEISASLLIRVILGLSTTVLLSSCGVMNSQIITALPSQTPAPTPGTDGDDITTSYPIWIEEAYIKAANANASDAFGTSVALSGDTIVVGAPTEDSNQTTITNGTTASNDNSASNSGAAYVYKRTGTIWAQEAYLKAANADANDGFGNSVFIDEDTIAVGAAAESSNQTTITNGATASADNSVLSSGAVYVFKRTGTNWSEEAYIKAANADLGDGFGIVSLNRNTIVVGANLEDSSQTTITNGATASADNSVSGAGAVYVYKRTGTTWAQEAYIKAANPELNDNFGVSVSINDDTIVVGANGEDSNQTTITNGATASADNSALNSGAAYVYKRTGTTWAQEAYIKAANTADSNKFGGINNVSISGDTIVVGAYGESSNQTTITNGATASADNSNFNAGAAYIYKRTGTTWAQEAYIKAANSEAGDDFGSVSMSSDTLVVGAFGEDSNQTTITNGVTASADNSALNSGAAYVYKRTGTTWAQEAYLKAANAGAGDFFGYSVSINGDTIAVGAKGESSNQTTITNGSGASSDNSAASSGAVYVFKRKFTADNGWSQQAYIKAINAHSSATFGYSVAIDKDTAVVGARTESSSQTTITNGTTASNDTSAMFAGAAYVYKRTGTTWAQEAYIKAANADAQDRFGQAVSISGDTIVVGAIFESSNQTTITNGNTASANNGSHESGAAYVYKRTGTTWVQEAYIKAANADANDSFGTAVSVNGDTIVVAATWEDSNQTTITNGATASADNSAVSSGAAYVYKRTGTTWAQEAYIKAANAEGGDFFGQSLSVDGDTVAVSAFCEASNQTTITNGATASADNSVGCSGAVYVYKRTSTNWAQEAYIKAPNPDINDYFGTAVSVNGDTIVVGAQNESSSQTTITNGATASADNSLSASGAVYVFKRTGTAWAQEAYIKAANADSNDLFGASVSVSKDIIAIGAYQESSSQTTITNGTIASSDNSLSDSGAVYIYKRTGTTWAEEAYLKASNPSLNDQFGFSVAIDRDTVIVGANQQAISSGAVYIYIRNP